MLEHHAYICEGTPTLLPEVERIMRERAGFLRNSPDVFTQVYEKFGIKDARELYNRATIKSSDGHALFIIAVVSITTEAQQAMLKLFEEPQAGAVFVLIIPHGIVLPTLRSRCLSFESLKTDSLHTVLVGGGVKNNEKAKEFLSSGYKERSAMVTMIVKKCKDNNTVARDFLDELERELYSKFNPTDISSQPTIKEGLYDIMLFRKYLADRSPSIKMLFEHLAASLLQIK